MVDMIDKAVRDYCETTGKEPTVVYVSLRSWYELLHEFNYVGFHPPLGHNPHKVSIVTICGDVNVEVKFDLPDEMPICNPDEYKQWLDDEFEKAVLI